MNNIVIKKVWQDNDFFETEIECFSESVIAKSLVFISNERFDNLIKKLEVFIYNPDFKDVVWESGTKGDESTACIVFDFKRVDQKGHIDIEVFMEINDGGKLSKHNCCFFVKTEIQLLINFLNRLKSFDVFEGKAYLVEQP